MESPPKRMTRSRAAAKATEPAINSTRIVTAAARARSTATAGTKSTAAKRKTRADENEEDEEQLHKGTSAIKRPARGRPRKAAEPEEVSSAVAPTMTARPARGRPPKKASVAEVIKEDPTPAPRAVRGRPRKVVESAVKETAPEPAPRSTRTRGATSTTVSAAAKATTAAKKAVKFQEPDKENIEPVAKKAPVVTSIRGRPAKRGPVGAPRRPQVAEKEKKPLSPKKVTQLSMATRDEESEDELAGGDYAPVPLMKKNPVKPPTAAPVLAKQLELNHVEPDADSTMQVNFDILNPPALTSNIASPARRPPAEASPFKDTMRSPARRVAITFPGSALKSARSHGATEQGSPFKGTLLQSAVKRPPSPLKGLQPISAFNPLGTASPAKLSILQSPAKRGMPGFRPLMDLPQREQLGGLGSPVAKSQTPSAGLSAKKPSEKLLMDEDLVDDEVDGLVEIDAIKFPGRLSAVFPREADPSFVEEDEDAEDGDQQEQIIDTNNCLPEETQPELCEVEDEQVESGDETENEEENENGEDNKVEEQQPTVSSPLSSPGIHDSINVAVPSEGEETSSSTPSTPSASPVANKNPMYQLRPVDLDPCDATDSESEDDATMHTQATPTTASLFAAKSSRRSTLGFTSLAEQFGAWSAASPTKPTPSALREARVESPGLGSGEVSPAVENFFENEMLVQPEVPSVSMEFGAEETPFDDVMILDEDIELAQEADDLSLMEPRQLLKPEAQSFDDSLSDASQEYGDENQVPIDPAVAATTTPVRPLMKTFHTTTKVPLKPADESTPSPVKKRSLSASRVTMKRPSVGLTRNATVISYSPTKDRRSSRAATQAADRSTMPETPSKSDMWSNMGTPARTPRKDVDAALLRGAVVYVDVHTSEGADASGIFVELLTQMGARCVKAWHWNPNSLSGEEASSSKVGITHVVYKDGGKRTLEKVRQTDGVVQCVGVSWVLDCERENQWLEESPYYIDTSLVPRGGARRRKSMEPRALANQNGTLVGNGSKSNNGSRQSMGPPATPVNRRQSTVWMHSPSEGVEDQDDDDDDIEWSKFILTPVPKTPAPEAVAKYAAEIPQTPGADDTEMDLSPTKQDLLTRTCPPKKSSLFHDLGHGILNKDKDEQVLLRLMAARRKSLQFAPKIGSPLAKTWA